MGVLFLPDRNPGVGLAPVEWPRHGSPSAVLHERARSHASGEVTGSLSIKCMFGGSAAYSTEGRRVVVDDDRYLLLNHRQSYSMEIKSRTPVESFCVFFQAGLVEDVHRGLTAEDSRLLDSPWEQSAPISVFDRLYPHDDIVTPRLLRLRQRIGEGAAAESLEEDLHLLAASLLRAQVSIYREAERVPAARASTRHEIARRLGHARDLIESSYEERLTLSRLASTACMSPYHFLRQYSALYGVSPHQHLLERRLQAARRLLATSDLPVTAVALRTGFESPSHFSNAFRRRSGCSPVQYRRANRGSLRI